MSRMDMLIAATHAGADLDRCLQALDRSRGDLDIRIILSTREPFTAKAAMRDLEVLVLPDADIFGLRLASYLHATAPILGMTEDHCEVDAAWCRAMLEAFDDPDVAVAAGPVENGDPCTLGGWANYYTNFARTLPAPDEGPPGPRTATAPCLAWRANALEIVAESAPYHLDFLYTVGRRPVRWVEEAKVYHNQPLKALKATVHQYHNARVGMDLLHTHAGLPRRRPLRKLVLLPWLQLRRMARSYRVLRAHPDHRRRAVRVLPAWTFMALGIAFGHWMGTFFGRGRSMEHVF